MSTYPRLFPAIAVLLLFAGPAAAQGSQEDPIDPAAITILDRMTQMLGSLTACTVTVESAVDLPDASFFVPMEGVGSVKRFGIHEVAFSGPDRFMVNTRNDDEHLGFWYNGDYVTYYSYTRNNFAVVDGDSTSLETIYHLNEAYGVDFPVADFFNPSFTDDLIDFSEQIYFLGSKTVAGKPCFHILAKLPDRSVQIWVNNDPWNLPYKMVIIYLDQDDNPQYEATFTDWNLNPDLPDELFEFVPPASASLLTLVPKEEK